jgi:hypothetical protein
MIPDLRKSIALGKYPGFAIYFLVRAAVIVERSVDAMKEAMKKLMKAAQVTGLRNLYAEDKIHENNKKPANAYSMEQSPS